MGDASIGGQRFDIPVVSGLVSGIHDLRSCVVPLHASLCVVVQCLIRPGVAGLRVHMYNCAPAVAVTRLLWSSFCLHVLCSVGAAADPLFLPIV